MWSYKPMWHCKYPAILESKVKFDETHIKMSKYENSVFPFFVHSTVNLPAWRPKHTLMSFLCLFTFSRQWLLKEKFFSKLHDKCCRNWRNPVRNCQRPILWHNHQNCDLSFRNFLLKYEPRSKKRNSMIKRKNIHKFVLFLHFKRSFS